MSDIAKDTKKWADDLQEILRDGTAAVRAGNAQGVVAVQKRLKQFKASSPDYADSLDYQASLAIIDLDLDNTQTALDGVQKRREAVDRITKLIVGVTEEARADAATLRGERIKAVIDSTTEAVRSLGSLKESLGKSADEKALAADIEQVVVAIQTVRNAIERV